MHRPTDAELMQEMHVRLKERMVRDGIHYLETSFPKSASSAYLFSQVVYMMP